MYKNYIIYKNHYLRNYIYIKEILNYIKIYSNINQLSLLVISIGSFGHIRRIHKSFCAQIQIRILGNECCIEQWSWLIIHNGLLELSVRFQSIPLYTCVNDQQSPKNNSLGLNMLNRLLIFEHLQGGNIGHQFFIFKVYWIFFFKNANFALELVHIILWNAKNDP